MKTLCYSVVKATSRVPLTFLKVEELSMKISILFFLLLLRHTTQTIGHIQIFYISNDCFTIKDIAFLVYSCMRGTTRKLLPQICIAVSLICHFVCGSTITRKQWGTCNSSRLHTKQLYYQGCFFLVESSNAATTYKLRFTYTSLSHYFVFKYAWQQNSGQLWLYYTPNNHFTTKDVSFRSTKWGTTYKLPSRTSIYISQCLCKYSVHYIICTVMIYICCAQKITFIFKLF